MSIKDDFKGYIDGNGLLAPAPVPVGTLKGSDNGPMFTGEYYTILKKQGLLTDEDTSNFIRLINNCISSNGLLNRVPTNQSDGQEQADDYYGVLDGCVQLGITSIPRTLLWSAIRHFGFLNNVPGSPNNLDNFLVRQPALPTSMISAAFPKLYNPLHLLIRLVYWPLYLLTAIIIATACIDTPTNQADPRRLSWHVLQINSKVSLMCYLASFIWYKRLYKDYGSAGMKGVASFYYASQQVTKNAQGNYTVAFNPWKTYWVTK